MNFDKIRNFSGLRDLSTIGFANIIGGGISVIFWLYLAALLGEENYGQVSYMIAIATVASVFPLLGAANTVTVYAAKKVNILPVVSVLSISSSIVTAVILLILFENPVVSIYAIGYVIFNISLAEMLGRKQYKNYSKGFIIQKVFLVIFSIPLYYIMGPPGVVLGFALSFLPFSYQIAKRIKELGVDLSVLKPRLGFMMNNLGTDISQTFSHNIDKIIIAPLMGFALLGNYHLGIQFLALLTMLPAIVLTYTLPQDASGTPRTKLKKITIVISIGLALLGIILSPILTPLFFPHYEEAVTIIQIMSLAIIPRTVSIMIHSKFLGREKSRFVVMGAVIFLGIQIPGIFILGEIFNVNGVAASLVLAETAQAGFLLFANRFLFQH